MARIFGVILSHNCENLLPKAVARTPRNYFEKLIVSDNASTDNSVSVAKELGLTVVTAKNPGYGANLKMGLRYAYNEGADYVVEIHGDGAQFNPNATLTAMHFIDKNYDFIIGSRFIDVGKARSLKMPLARMTANILLSKIDNLVLGLPFSEYHTGFRIYGPAFKEIRFEENSDNYLFSFEIIAQAALLELACAEVPVECDYSQEHTSPSYFASAIYAIAHFKTLFDFILAKYFEIRRGVFKNV